MSTPQTNFLVWDLDLSSIFKPISLRTAYPIASCYTIHGGNDSSSNSMDVILYSSRRSWSEGGNGQIILYLS